MYDPFVKLKKGNSNNCNICWHGLRRDEIDNTTKLISLNIKAINTYSLLKTETTNN